MERTTRTYRTALLLAGALALGGCSPKVVDGSVEDAGFTCYDAGLSIRDYFCVERRSNGEQLKYWFDLSDAGRTYLNAKRQSNLSTAERDAIVPPDWMATHIEIEFKRPGGSAETLPTPRGSLAEAAALARADQYVKSIIDKEIADDLKTAARITGR